MVTTSINALETRFTVDLAGSADELVKSSSYEQNLLTQHNWERLAVVMAASIADFLYQRDTDLLFLAASLEGVDDKQSFMTCSVAARQRSPPCPRCIVMMPKAIHGCANTPC